MTKNIIFVFSVIFVCVFATVSFADQTIVSAKVTREPVINGAGTDAVWTEATEYTTHDNTADIDIKIKTVHTDKKIFFLVSYPDPDKSDTHKLWTWNSGEDRYKSGLDREDMFVIKWNMNPGPVDLSLTSNDEYKADIWFWKAFRTDPMGYADDKYQVYGATKRAKSTKLISKTGKAMYLIRRGDAGTSAYKSTFYVDHVNDKMSHFDHVVPTGSRGDIKAKGVWVDGRWTIEFERALVTGNDDDVQFDNMSKEYIFGVSRYEVAGRKPEPAITQPLYGAGDISEGLVLNFST